MKKLFLLAAMSAVFLVASCTDTSTEIIPEPEPIPIVEVVPEVPVNPVVEIPEIADDECPMQKATYEICMDSFAGNTSVSESDKDNECSTISSDWVETHGCGGE